MAGLKVLQLALVDTRTQFDHLAGVYLRIAAAVVAIVFGSILYVVVRYRRRDDRVPRQHEGAPRAEITYAVGLAAVAAVLVTLTFRTQGRVEAVTPRPALPVSVTAAKWNWRFTYPSLGVTRVSGQTRRTTLLVPSDRTVRFSLTSRDVIHAFWVPYVRFKRDAFPQRTTHFDLVFDRPGFYSGRCAEFCGLDHSDMDFTVEVLSPAEFDRWASRQSRRSG